MRRALDASVASSAASRLKVCIIGAGSIGCLYSARIGSSGKADVTLVARESACRKEMLPRSTRSTQELGSSLVRLRELDGSESRADVRLAQGISVLDFTACSESNRKSTVEPPFDVVLVTVKHRDTAEVGNMLGMASMRGVIGPLTTIVSLQNGMGNVELLRHGMLESIATYSPSHEGQIGPVVQGITYQGAGPLDQLYVSHNGHGKTFIALEDSDSMREVAALSVADILKARKQREEKLNRFAAAFNEGCAYRESELCQVTPNAQSMVFTKLLANVVINPLTALLNLSNGSIADPRYRTLVDTAAAEFQLFLTTRGDDATHLLLNDNENASEYILRVAQATKDNTSSMLADVRANRTTEIEAMNGYVVREAKAKGLELPVLESLYKLVLALEPPTK